MLRFLKERAMVNKEIIPLINELRQRLECIDRMQAPTTVEQSLMVLEQFIDFTEFLAQTEDILAKVEITSKKYKLFKELKENIKIRNIPEFTTDCKSGQITMDNVLLWDLERLHLLTVREWYNLPKNNVHNYINDSCGNPLWLGTVIAQYQVLQWMKDISTGINNILEQFDVAA